MMGQRVKRMPRPATSATPAEPQSTVPARPGEASRVKSPWERFGFLMAVVWLVFLGYPIVALVQSTAALFWLVVGWAALVAFAGLYVTGFVRGLSGNAGGLVTPPHRIQWVWFAAMIGCAVISIPAVSASALSYVPFLMAFASYGLTRAAHWITAAAGVVITAVVVVVLPDGSDYLAVLAIIIMLGVVNTVSTTLIIRSEQTERLGRELATSEGREAVARDVHDLIGHSLTVVRLKAQLARRLIDTDPARAKAELADIEKLSAEAIADVRATVAGVRAGTLAEQLSSSRAALAAAGVTMVCEGEPGMLSPVQALTAGWILREATTNVLRHAHAQTMTVRIVPGGLTISDDGVGYARADGAGEGSGIRGMRERAAASHAKLSVRTGTDTPNAPGTRVEVIW